MCNTLDADAMTQMRMHVAGTAVGLLHSVGCYKPMDAILGRLLALLLPSRYRVRLEAFQN